MVCSLKYQIWGWWILLLFSTGISHNGTLPATIAHLGCSSMVPGRSTRSISPHPRSEEFLWIFGGFHVFFCEILFFWRRNILVYQFYRWEGGWLESYQEKSGVQENGIQAWRSSDDPSTVRADLYACGSFWVCSSFHRF